MSGATRIVLVAVVAFSLSLVGSVTGVLPGIGASGGVGGAVYVPDRLGVPSGLELSLTYIGASHCGPANHPLLPKAIEAVKVRLASYADSQNLGFSVTGVAQEWNAHSGVRYLQKFGYFDEIASGRDALNLAVLRYVWHETPGHVGTPQLLVTIRRVDRPTAEQPQILHDLVAERTVVRKVGLSEILGWVELGIPVPHFTVDVR